MARTLTPEEAEREYMVAMGDSLGRLFHALSNEVTWLHESWRQYRILFATNEERIVLLNEAAGLFFRLVQDAFWEQTMLFLCRLTDPPNSCGKPNLTIRRIPPLVSPDIRVDVTSLVDAAIQRTEFARDWRNRHIAHTDYNLALDEKATPLMAASRINVQQALDAITAIFQRLEEQYMKATVIYEPPLGGAGDAESLLLALREGVDAILAREKRIQEGKFLEEDLNPPRSV